MRVLHVLAAAVALSAAATLVDIKPVVATDSAAADPDDPAIWVNPAHPERSLIVGTIKVAAPRGALCIYGLDGKLKQTVSALDRPNNVDVEYGLRIGGRTVDIVVVTERLKRQLRVYAISGDGLSHLSAIPVFDGEPGESGAPMGIALYKRPREGTIFAIVSRKTGPASGYLWQYRLEDDRAGGVRGVRVRAFGAYSGGAENEIEAVAVDDALGYVYYADERAGIRKWHADPDHANANSELALFGQTGFAADREGIAVYARPNGTGYIICTDQVAGNSEYRMYRREGGTGGPHDHSEVVKVVRGGADATDGIEVNATALGPRFPAGAFVVMNTRDRNFLVFNWTDIANAGIAKLQ